MCCMQIFLTHILFAWVFQCCMMRHTVQCEYKQIRILHIAIACTDKRYSQHILGVEHETYWYVTGDKIGLQMMVREGATHQWIALFSKQ